MGMTHYLPAFAFTTHHDVSLSDQGAVLGYVQHQMLTVQAINDCSGLSIQSVCSKIE